MENDNDYDDTGVLEEDTWKEQSDAAKTGGWNNENIMNQEDDWGEATNPEDFKESFEPSRDAWTEKNAGSAGPAEDISEQTLTGTEQYFQKRWGGNVDNTFPSEEKRNWREVKPGEVHFVNVGFGQSLVKMPREAWGAIRPFNRTSLDLPVPKVRFTHTGTETCSTKEECMQRCREIQKYFMDLGFADIPYNFLIGGDGILYHGRGWMKQADRPHPFRKLRRTCVDVAYIGNFEDKQVPYEMLSVAADFIKYGLKNKSITPFFQAYCFLGEDIKSRNNDELGQELEDI